MYVLEGIDLSGNMLAEAMKNAYSKLTKQDITEYLSNADLNFDYFVATDVFIYIGNLSNIFRLIRCRNQKVASLFFRLSILMVTVFFSKKQGDIHIQQNISRPSQNFQL